MLCCVMLCYVMLCCVRLCYVMLCYVMLCYVMVVMLCYHCMMLYKKVKTESVSDGRPQARLPARLEHQLLLLNLPAHLRV